MLRVTWFVTSSFAVFEAVIWDKINVYDNSVIENSKKEKLQK